MLRGKVINAAYHFSLSPGIVFEEYRIVSVLGQGSFGVTYLAEDVNLGMRLAIKEYLPSDWAFRDATQTVRAKSAAASESFERGRDAFLKEARLLAQVVHPNIVKVRRFFRAHGTAYIAMDFVGGRSLADVLNEDYHAGGYPSSVLKQLLVAMLGGLAALHEQRIIHRDIKPANIVIEGSGNPMLVDFGAARNFGPAVAQNMTVIVTPGYAPIEQYSDDGEQGPFTDIYALGALAYRAITGHPPDAPYKRLGSNSSLPAAIVGVGKYPQPLLEAIDWALAVQPQDRPQSAEALLAKVRAAPDALPDPVDEPTQILSEATQTLETFRWRNAAKGNPGTARAELSLKSGQAESVEPPQTARAKASARADASAVVATKRLGKLAPIFAGALLFTVAIGAGAYYLEPFGSSTADQDAATKARKDEAAAEAARAAAARQAAARAEAERAAAAAAQQKADKEAAEAARAEAARQAAAKAEADRQAAAKAEAERQAAAKAEADRQAAARAEAERQAATAAEAARQAAARAESERAAAAAAQQKADNEAAEAARAEAARQEAAKAEVDRQAAAKAEAERQAAAKAEADAAKAEAERQAVAARQSAARDAAARTQEQRAAAAANAAATKAKRAPLETAVTAPSDRNRCSTILQNAQLKEQISDADKTFLREHCH